MYVLTYLCAGFYALLCVFSIVTGIMYMTGKRELNPLELSDSFVEKLSEEGNLQKFARFMGFVTFVVGLAQGLAAYGITVPILCQNDSNNS